MKALAEKARRIEYHSIHLANSLLSGLWKSAFKGSGIEFEEVRPYTPGDDVRAIDWRVTTRMDQPFVKLYREEREMNVFFLVDASASCHFGLKAELKSDLIAEVVALLSFSAIHNHDKVALLLFSDEIELYHPPRRGRRDVLQLLRDLLLFVPKRKTTSIQAALSALLHLSIKPSLIFLLSDFLAPFDYKKELALLSKRHDVVLLHVEDPFERELPQLPFVNLSQIETGSRRTVSFAASSDEYRERREKWMEELKKLANRLSLDLLTLPTGGGHEELLRAFFKRRGEWRR